MSEHGENPNAEREHNHSDDLLIDAVESQEWNTVKKLLERGANPNAQGGFYGNALQAAAYNGSLNTVKLLLESGANPNVQGGEYGNALQAAVYNGSLNTVKLLLESGANPNVQGGEYGNALQAAVYNGSLNTVKLLLESGANPNVQGGEYGNALQAAVYNGSLNTVKLLLESGADPNAQGGYRGNALQAAAAYGSLDAVKLLFESGADPNAQGGPCGNALQAAAGKGHLEIVELLLNCAADVTIQPKLASRLSLLHVATASKNIAVLEKLCDEGADIHLTSQDESGQTPLHTAVDDGCFAIAEFLLNRGASPDIEDFGNMNSFQLAMRNQNRDMVLLLYPKTTAGLSTISASDWRRCSSLGSKCNIELINDGSAKVIFRDENLEKELKELSYPLSFTSEDVYSYRRHFMDNHRDGKRIFIVGDGSMLHPETAFNFHCRWWSLREDCLWTVQMNSAPSRNTVRQKTAKDCFLDCALSVTCYTLPQNLEDWPNDVQLEIDSLKGFESRQGILWIMMKPEARNAVTHSNDSVLQSRIFLSTSEYAEIPDMATDLLLPLILKIRSIWVQNFSLFQKRCGLMRSRILRSSGSDPSLIQDLLIDAKFLEILKENLTRQIDTLRSFRDWYQSESASTSHEPPLNEIRDKMVDLARATNELQTTTERELRILAESSQNMIQLEFNLTSITEAQKSTSTNKSMKRLSWITFIFLPLLFIASLFGMNVDVLKNNPSWWWYLPLAALTTLLTFVVWMIFKRNKSLEGNLEKHFQWLFPQPKGEQDLEMSSGPNYEASGSESDFEAMGAEPVFEAIGSESESEAIGAQTTPLPTSEKTRSWTTALKARWKRVGEGEWLGKLLGGREGL